MLSRKFYSSSNSVTLKIYTEASSRDSVIGVIKLSSL